MPETSSSSSNRSCSAGVGDVSWLNDCGASGECSALQSGNYKAGTQQQLPSSLSVLQGYQSTTVRNTAFCPWMTSEKDRSNLETFLRDHIHSHARLSKIRIMPFSLNQQCVRIALRTKVCVFTKITAIRSFGHGLHTDCSA